MTGRPSVIAEVIATDAAADAAPIDWEDTARLFRQRHRLVPARQR